jgi:hypothetical protein
MRLYHGTNQNFEVIDLNHSKPNKDFGKGFYLSPVLQQATELAQTRASLYGGTPIVQTYELEDAVLESPDLKILRFTLYDEAWAQFILLNRNNTTPRPAHDYDIVIGPIADDKVGAQLFRYNNHDIDMETLIRHLKFFKGITYQYYFGSQRAINLLTRV